MTNPPPVAPVEGHLYLLFAEYENTINIRKWSKKPFDDAVEYVRKSELSKLIAACDLALNWADANARWFDISTAPRDGTILLLSGGRFFCEKRETLISEPATACWGNNYWLIVGLESGYVCASYDKPTHWRPLPPPPSNPPLPEPLEALGAALRRVKGENG